LSLFYFRVGIYREGGECNVVAKSLALGGMSNDIAQLKLTILISTLVAITGILCPIGISLIYLKYAYGYSTIEAFAAGASLSSTSMGTTFTILSSTNLAQSKVGVVLVSAALIDDIAGLIIAGIISLLASDYNTVGLGWTIARPLVASLCVIAIPIPVTRFILAPCYSKAKKWIPERYFKSLNLFIIIGLMSSMATIARYAGTSSLLGGFIAGMIVAYLDSQGIDPADANRFNSVFDQYIGQLQYIFFEPMFFASIGFAIPFVDLFNATVAWRGFAFGIISIMTKSLTGLWILLWSSRHTKSADPLQLEAITETTEPQISEPRQGRSIHCLRFPTRNNRKQWRLPDEHGILAAVLLGMSMIARGEVGLLIANLAYTQNGPLHKESFLVCIWAILICTVIGPIGVGVLARHRHSRIMGGSWGKFHLPNLQNDTS
jgi:Kef-type K+ transport system membrane component KefB